MIKYRVEQLIGDNWYQKTCETTKEVCAKYINDEGKLYPKKVFRILKIDYSVEETFEASDVEAPKRITHCKHCDCIIHEYADSVWTTAFEDTGYFCSEKCTLDYLKQNYVVELKPDNPDYKYVGWYFEDEDED